MYAGANSPKKRKKHRRRSKRNLTGILFGIFVILVFVTILSITVSTVRGFLAPEPTPSGVQLTSQPPRRDTQPPQISGVEDITVYQEDAVAYRKGILVTDDTDPDPRLEVDSSHVDLTTPGSYEVIYIATDDAGNVARERATVTVLQKQAGFVEIQAIYDAADKILSQIIQPGDTTRQQVRAIYVWAKTSIGYAGHSDRTDWRQTAYLSIRDRQGDCYGYFAVCKLLLERLGIPNIDVVKVKNSSGDSEHFWSLVSIDGGESYYHLDATPRVGDGDNFCLVTDAYLDAYSERHKGSHHRDTSLYPATPTEELP